MSDIMGRCLLLIVLATVFGGVYSCTQPGVGTVPNIPGSTTVTPPSASDNIGLDEREHLRVSPPPPRNLSGTFRADHVELSWDTPATVTVPHNYSDTITHYKIYRGTGTGNMTYLASCPGLTYNDFAISGSPQYVYEVTAVHQGSTESVPSQEITVRVSSTGKNGLNP